MLIMRKMSAFSSTPALMTGDSLWASTTFLPLIVTTSRKVPLVMIGSGFQVVEQVPAKENRFVVGSGQPTPPARRPRCRHSPCTGKDGRSIPREFHPRWDADFAQDSP